VKQLGTTTVVRLVPDPPDPDGRHAKWYAFFVIQRGHAELLGAIASDKDLRLDGERLVLVDGSCTRDVQVSGTIATDTTCHD
jgi:hypothetical protein